MIASFRNKLSTLSRTAPNRRPPGAARRARLGFYGFRYRPARSRTGRVARGAIAAAVLIATIAAASEQFGR